MKGKREKRQLTSNFSPLCNLACNSAIIPSSNCPRHRNTLHTIKTAKNGHPSSFPLAQRVPQKDFKSRLNASQQPNPRHKNQKGEERTERGKPKGTNKTAQRNNARTKADAGVQKGGSN